MSDTIDLKGLNKAEVLAALYNASKPQSMGFMQYTPEPMTTEQAAELLERQTYFDYLNGRVMKVDLAGDVLDPWGYDRDNGNGATARALASMHANNQEIRHTHADSTVRAAQQVQSKLGESTKSEEGVVTLGLSDMKHVLGPKVAKAKHQNKNK